MFGNNVQSQYIMNHIPKDSEGAELGVWKGNTSQRFLDCGIKKLHLVDSWSTIPYVESDDFGGYDKYLARYEKIVGSRDPKRFDQFYNDVYKSVVLRFMHAPVEIHRMTTTQWFDTFEGKLDWIYVDADHSEEGCYADLIRCKEVVKPGGMIMGDDCDDSKPGVLAAVLRFKDEHPEYPFEKIAGSQYIFRV